MPRPVEDFASPTSNQWRAYKRPMGRLEHSSSPPRRAKRRRRHRSPPTPMPQPEPEQYRERSPRPTRDRRGRFSSAGLMPMRPRRAPRRRPPRDDSDVEVLDSTEEVPEWTCSRCQHKNRSREDACNRCEWANEDSSSAPPPGQRFVSRSPVLPPLSRSPIREETPPRRKRRRRDTDANGNRTLSEEGDGDSFGRPLEAREPPPRPQAGTGRRRGHRKRPAEQKREAKFLDLTGEDEEEGDQATDNHKTRSELLAERTSLNTRIIAQGKKIEQLLEQKQDSGRKAADLEKLIYNTKSNNASYQRKLKDCHETIAELEGQRNQEVARHTQTKAQLEMAAKRMFRIERDLLTKSRQVSELELDQKDNETLIKVLEETSSSSNPNWPCSMCTFINSFTNLQCCMCGGPRPAVPAMDLTADNPADGQSEEEQRNYMYDIANVTAAKKNELVQLCKTVGVDFKGKKPELQQRLIMHYVTEMQKQAAKAVKTKEEEMSSSSPTFKKLLEDHRELLKRSKSQQSEMSELERRTKDKSTCSICLENTPLYVCQPCQHMCLCRDCVPKMVEMNEDKCPICRVKWHNIPVQVFTT